MWKGPELFRVKLNQIRVFVDMFTLELQLCTRVDNAVQIHAQNPVLSDFEHKYVLNYFQ